MWLLSHVLLPGIARAIGYVPARLIAQGEDLPAGVALDWARWCRHPGYVVGALGVQERYARFTAPLRVYTVSDDAYAPPRAVEAYLAFYPNAPRQVERVEAGTLEGGPIGHFGFFRERFKDTLWRQAADWMEAR
jgi:predicted alpha/beta hydrolase